VITRKQVDNYVAHQLMLDDGSLEWEQSCGIPSGAVTNVRLYRVNGDDSCGNYRGNGVYPTRILHELKLPVTNRQKININTICGT